MSYHISVAAMKKKQQFVLQISQFKIGKIELYCCIAHEIQSSKQLILNAHNDTRHAENQHIWHFSHEINYWSISTYFKFCDKFVFFSFVLIIWATECACFCFDNDVLRATKNISNVIILVLLALGYFGSCDSFIRFLLPYSIDLIQ